MQKIGRILSTAAFHLRPMRSVEEKIEMFILGSIGCWKEQCVLTNLFSQSLLSIPS